MSLDIRQVYLLDFGNKIGYVGCAIDPYKRCYQHIKGTSGVEQVADQISNMLPGLPQIKILDEFDNKHLINLKGIKSINVKLEQVYMWDFIGRGWSLLNKNLGSWPLFVTEEIRTAMSEAKKGHIVSEEAKRKISESMKGNQHGRGNIGKKHSIETRAKISKALMGKQSEGLGGSIGCCVRHHSNRPRVFDTKLCQECLDKALAKGFTKRNFTK